MQPLVLSAAMQFLRCVPAGLTVTDGAAPQGGCVLIMGASPTIENMHFAICTALTLPASGGAIYVEATAPGRSVFACSS